jgi:protein ImuB
MQKRVVSLWFPRLASDRFLRAWPIDAPFALIERQNNTERLYCLNQLATNEGLHVGMGYADARAFCPNLQTRPVDIEGDQRFLHTLVKWAKRYCPWVGIEGVDGLVLNVTGSVHLYQNEVTFLNDIHWRIERAGISVRSGMADTRGAAWAIAHYGKGIATEGQSLNAIGTLPIAALRLDSKTCISLQRLGIRKILDLTALPRSTITRRFGAVVLLRLDQALGAQPEDISPIEDPPRYQSRLNLPDPIGLEADVLAGTERLLTQLCDRLKQQEVGARVLSLNLRRVDRGTQQIELRLACPMRDPARILPLFTRGIGGIDAGFGIDQLRLIATQVERLATKQISHTTGKTNGHLDDLITRIGNRIGLENVQRLLPADSHIPEHSFTIAPVAYSKADGSWGRDRERPIQLFNPERIQGTGSIPPKSIRWRRMYFTVGHITGPERIAPEWWLPDENWQSGVRDYWKVETNEGRRLWMFYTPQNPSWFVHGEFP